jgi:hypothetical protein
MGMQISNHNSHKAEKAGICLSMFRLVFLFYLNDVNTRPCLPHMHDLNCQQQ